MKNYMDITEKIKWTYTIHGGVYILAAVFAVLEVVLRMDTVFLVLQAICFTAASVICSKALKEEKCINDEMSEYNLRRAKATTFDFAKVFILIIFAALYLMRAFDKFEFAMANMMPYILAVLMFAYGIGNLATGFFFKMYEEE